MANKPKSRAPIDKPKADKSPKKPDNKGSINPLTTPEGEPIGSAPQVRIKLKTPFLKSTIKRY